MGKKTWYFTYGQSGSQPFEGGWTEVIAETRRQAIDMFRTFHDDSSSGYVNCAGIYSAEEFEKTDMPANGNYDYRAVEVIRFCRGELKREYTLSYLCLRFREFMGITQAQLAKLCNIDRTTLWKIEKGGKCTDRIQKNVRKVVEKIQNF